MKHLYFLSKNRRELKTLLKIAERKGDREQAIRIRGYLDDYPKRHPQAVENEEVRRKERRQAINFQVDGHVLGRQGAGHDPVTIRQLLLLLAMGIGGFTLALDEYLKGPGRGDSLQAFRNTGLMITGFLVILVSIWLLIGGR